MMKTAYEILKERRIKMKKLYGIGAGSLSRYGIKRWLFLKEKYNGKCADCYTENDLCIFNINGKGRYFKNRTGEKIDNRLDNLKFLCRRCVGKISGKKNPGDPNTSNLKHARGKYPRTQEHCRNISLAKIGKKLSKEHRMKISNKLKGRTIPIEIRLKMSQSNRGEKSHLWKGGVSKLSEKIRKSKQYIKWRIEVYTRDNYTCTVCNSRSGKGSKVFLNAHHVNPFGVIVQKNNIKSLIEAKLCDELWDISNGITLCQKCHKIEHFNKNSSSSPV